MSTTAGADEAGEAYPPHRRVQAVASTGLLVVGWLIVAVLGLVAFLRLVTWDSLEPLIVLDALTLVIYLPAWIVAAGALIARRWWLAAAAVVVVAAQLAFAAPSYWPPALCPPGRGKHRQYGCSTPTWTKASLSKRVTRGPSSETVPT